MELYREYPHGLSFYAVLMRLQRAFWRCLHAFLERPRPLLQLPASRLVKTSDKPVWMDQAEKATGDFYDFLRA